MLAAQLCDYFHNSMKIRESVVGGGGPDVVNTVGPVDPGGLQAAISGPGHVAMKRVPNVEHALPRPPGPAQGHLKDVRMRFVGPGLLGADHMGDSEPVCVQGCVQVVMVHIGYDTNRDVELVQNGVGLGMKRRIPPVAPQSAYIRLRVNLPSPSLYGRGQAGTFTRVQRPETRSVAFGDGPEKFIAPGRDELTRFGAESKISHHPGADRMDDLAVTRGQGSEKVQENTLDSCLSMVHASSVRDARPGANYEAGIENPAVDA